ncbi:ATP-binding protein [Leptolyngbya sp. GGD]|uniref:ATP-binding protein n=1 Tax=Leptolyngbya sp. GGD TaxID=2997907 RepID=UPI00227C30AD|nr:ATP-binding protein [Leptolyngbya sp. GGD]MCY6493970.1 hypothetical protein [Leptolyngbya sp. GGD]
MPTPENSQNADFSNASFSGAFQLNEDLDTSLSPISASISLQILTKVTRLFNAGLEDIVNELFQNARRAGATQVKVSLTESGNLRIEDNGCGIESAQTLLNLGQSDWEGEIVESEDPAGMGVFSLANRGAMIASHHWQVQLEPAHFSGQAIAIVQSTEPRIGTCIEFPLTAQEQKRSLSTVIENAARYFPIPVSFNETDLPRHDFLAGAQMIKSWRGLRLGVSGDYRWTQRSRDGALNFYGLTVQAYLPSLCCNETTLRTRVDVEFAPELKLVLPARKEIVQTEFFEQLKLELRKTLYEAVARLESHNLSHTHWLEARNFGIDLSLARSELEPFTPAIADHLAGQGWNSPQPIDATTIVVEVDELEAPQQQLFARALEKSDLPFTFLAAESKYQGYPWYDELPRLSFERIEIQIGDRILSPTEFARLEEFPQQGIVDQITAIVTRKQAGKPDTELRLELDVGFGAMDEFEYIPSLDEITIAIARHHSLNPYELAELLEASFFSPSEDSDADSYETQRENFRESAQEESIRLLLSSESALKARIEMIVDRYLRWIVPSNMKIEVRVSPISSDENSERTLFNRSVEIIGNPEETSES